MKISAIRLTLYAFISSIEEDLRYFIKQRIMPFQNNFFDFDADLKDNLIKRIKADIGISMVDIEENDLLDYIDFGDVIKVWGKYINNLSDAEKIGIKEISKIIITLIPIRNRVMHTRPLQTQDFTILYDEVQNLIKINIVNWVNLNNTIKYLKEDPSYVFNLKIPNYEYSDRSDIYNNLPIPEFDETGLIGRETEVKEIYDLIFTHHRIITIVGEGGIGKTATLLNCLYNILDLEVKPFDAVIWASLKTHDLTVNGIKTINEAISNATGLFSKINQELSGFEHSSIENTIKEVINYLNEFKILLAIDNLETLNDNTVRDFITNIKQNSKVIITSRIGIGEIEIRYPLLGLKENYALRLLNIFSKVRQVDNILKLSDGDKKNICHKMNYKPLAIRWFVLSAREGISPQKLLSYKGDLHKYCFSNVFSKLSEESKKVLDTLLIQKKGCSEAEIAFLSDLDHIGLKKALNQLDLTNIIKIETKKDSKGSLNNIFLLNESASEYLSEFHKPDKQVFVELNKRRKQLIAANQQIGSQVYKNLYTPQSIVFNSTDEKIAASFLMQALQESSKTESCINRLNKSIELVNRAKELCPSYSEVYRVSAFIKASCDDLYGANEDYETALEIDPESSSANFFYAGFLMRFLDDYERAQIYLDKVLEKDPNNIEVLIQKANLLKFTSKWKEADIIYEKVLNQKDDYSRKRYAFFVHMYTGNLKNRAEAEIEDKNYQKAEEILIRARNKIYELREAEFDDALFSRLNSIYSELIKCSVFTKNNDILDDIMNNYINHHTLFISDKHTKYTIGGFKKYQEIIGIPDKCYEKFRQIAELYNSFFNHDNL